MEKRNIVSALFFVFLLIERLQPCLCKCIESERKALLEFKDGLIDRANRLQSWVGEDCCRWAGVECFTQTGHVFKLDLQNRHIPDLSQGDYSSKFSKFRLGGKISSSLLELKQLKHLDLSMNNFSLSHIPPFISLFKNLEYLNLSSAGFIGKIPSDLGNLTSLLYLDLSSYKDHFHFNNFHVNSLQWLSDLSSLIYLDLSYSSLSNAINWLYEINTISTLQVLHLSSCELPNLPLYFHPNFTSLTNIDLSSNYFGNTIPSWLLNMTDLEYFDLSSNSFQGSIPPKLSDFCKLEVLSLSINSLFGKIFNNASACIQNSLRILDLVGNNFTGHFPEELGNFKKLEYLDLGGNSFFGSIPMSLGKLSSLRVLCLYANNLDSSITEIIHQLKNLEKLDISINLFSGSILVTLGELSFLRYINLYSNKFNGSIPDCFRRLSNLEVLIISNNFISGPIPTFIGNLSSLRQLDVSKNMLNGSITKNHFQSLTALAYLDTSSNSLTWDVRENWTPSFQLDYIDLSSNKVGPQFPPWLCTQKTIHTIIMPDAGISYSIPHCLVSISHSIRVLDLSSNLIRTFSPKFVLSSLDELSLSKNMLSGHIPNEIGKCLPNLSILDISRNYLSGRIPNSICNMKNLNFLVLSQNRLSGALPNCMQNLESLQGIDFGSNSFTGPIPSFLGNLSYLVFLHLNGNSFHGEPPRSLKNLRELVTVDFSDNNLTGSIPSWISANILNFQKNKFSGRIPRSLCKVSMLQVLHLGQNNLTGSIPRCFGNFSIMALGERSSLYNLSYRSRALEVIYFSSERTYQDNIHIFTKGIQLNLSQTLNYFVSIDLSNNNLDERIPQELMNLSQLENLNLSGNNLHGPIPLKISNLDKLESLDLSNNQLSGQLPPSLSTLHFLSHLNLSFNNFSGGIPGGYQLQTLSDVSIYIGNDGLCGCPLPKACPEDNKSRVQEHEGDDDMEHVWFCYGIATGFLVGFLGVCGTLVLNNRWRYAYFQLITDTYSNIYLAITVKVNMLRQKFH